MKALAILALTTLFFSLIFLVFLPFSALFFELAWNAVMSYLHLINNEINYWQSLKLCFFICMLRAFLKVKIELGQNKKQSSIRQSNFI